MELGRRISRTALTPSSSLLTAPCSRAAVDGAVKRSGWSMALASHLLLLLLVRLVRLFDTPKRLFPNSKREREINV